MGKQDCVGHESTNGPIGSTVFCDGSCRTMTQTREQAARQERSERTEREPSRSGYAGPTNSSVGTHRSFMPLLRPAADLTRERTEASSKSKERGHAVALARAVRAIEEAHAAKKNSCTEQTFPDSVVSTLRAQGYRVRLQSACGMGDVDSHVIEWD